jgi:hypothetical protein
MPYSNVIEVHFNWHTHPEHGCDWGFYRVGDRYMRATGGYVRCEDIEIDFEDGMHAICFFEDGTTEYQWNINKIVEAELNVYNKIKQHQGSKEGAELPKPSSY